MRHALPVRVHGADEALAPSPDSHWIVANGEVRAYGGR